MNTTQKIIKYVAIAFGVFLAFNIIAAIVLGITTVAGILIGIDTNYNINSFNEKNESLELTNVNVYEEVATLDIELSASNLQILEGEKFKVETDNIENTVNVEYKNNILDIKEKDKKIFNSKATNVIVYIPKEYIFDKVVIKTGAGTTYFEYLNSNELNLELGVGKTNIERIIAKNLNIKGGVGTVDISYFNTDKLNLETGVGKFYLKGKIDETASINCGIGKVDLGLIGSSEDYSITTNIGIGKIEILGKKCANNNIYGNGKVDIDVIGGIGKVNIDYINE